MSNTEMKELLKSLDFIVEQYDSQLPGLSKKDKRMIGLGVYTGIQLHSQLVDYKQKEKEKQWEANNEEMHGF